MLYELFAELRNHLIVQIGTVVCNNSLRDAISTDQIMLDKLRYDVLSNCSKGSWLNQLREVIDGY